MKLIDTLSKAQSEWQILLTTVNSLHLKSKAWQELVFIASYITWHQQYWLPGWRLAPLPVILLRDQPLSCPYLNITAVHYGLPSHSCWYLFYEHWRDQQCSGLSILGFAGLSNKFVFYNSCVRRHLGSKYGCGFFPL